MEQASERLKYDVDVGRQGITGHYSSFITALSNNGPYAIVTLAIWVWVINHSSLFDAHPIHDISPAWIVKAGLLVWTAMVWWPLIVGFQHFVRWKALESGGLQWVRRNDNDFRVTYYRSSDASLQYDTATRSERLDEELQVNAHRWQRFWYALAETTGYLALWIIVPLVFAYADEFLNPGLRTFIQYWDLAGIAQWLCFFLLALPKLCTLLILMYEGATYANGARYIPGAKQSDPVIPDKTLETMRAEEVYGAAAFVSPEQAARQMSGLPK